MTYLKKIILSIIIVIIGKNINCAIWEIALDNSGDFTSIQSGIDVSVEGDTVLVYPGTYYENMDINGKNITLCSLELLTGDSLYINNTIIDGSHLESCIRVHNGETDLIIQGFTIQNGWGTEFWAHDGGGLLVHDYSSVIIINSIFRKNKGEEGGAISARHGFISLSGVNLIENYGSFGGAIFLADDSTVEFDPVNRCDIYNNNAIKGADIFSINSGHLDVILDTFTLLEPDDFFIEGDNGSTFTCNILNGWMELVPHDLYLAENGDDSNDGLTPDTPLRNISWATRKIKATSDNPRTIHVASGTYSHANNQQIYPIGCKEFVSIIGENMDTTILENDFMTRTISGYLLHNPIYIRNFSIHNSLDYLSESLVDFQKVDSVYMSNISLCDNENISSITSFYKSGVYLDNIICKNNIARHTIGLGLIQAHGEVRNCKIVNNENTSGWANTALYIFANGNMLVENCEFGNNIAHGEDSFIIRISNTDYTTPHLKFVNCLIYGNQANNSNQVAFIMNEGTNDFINCTFVDNSAIWFGIRSETNVSLVNTILRNDTDREIYVQNNPHTGAVSELNVDYCNVRDGFGGVLNNGGQSIVNWGDNNIDLDPEFDFDSSLPYNLTLQSPCLDAGSNDFDYLYYPEYDLIGNQRIWDGNNDGSAIVDMGCYEFGSEESDSEEQVINDVNKFNLINFPNPFNPITTIEFTLSTNSEINLSIYNIKGQLIITLIKDHVKKGQHKIIWNGLDSLGNSLSSGVYLYHLGINGRTEAMNKCILLK